MIDFHSHVLPGMDDGSKSVNESVQMLRRTYEMGVDITISTPHYYSNFDSISSFLERRNDRYQALKCGLEGIDKVPCIVMGAEVSFFSGMSREKEISKLCIENTKYMLLEMPFSKWSSLTINEVRGLIANRGITPILAHFERYLPYMSKSGIAEELLNAGVVVQTNGEAVISSSSRKNILKMINSDKIQLLGSDCHNLSDRPPNLGEAFQIISKILGKSVLEKIDSNGRKILNDELI